MDERKQHRKEYMRQYFQKNAEKLRAYKSIWMRKRILQLKAEGNFDTKTRWKINK